jgi:phosphate transport system substrate-binding protein
MAQKSGPPPILYILLALLAAGGGYWYFAMRTPTESSNAVPAAGTETAPSSSVDAPLSTPSPVRSFSPPTTVPRGTTVRIAGSTSMVQINQALKRDFEGQFPGALVKTAAGGSSKGIQDLSAGKVDIAAVSRVLSDQELSQGLVAVPITEDAIAIVVGDANPFRKGLTDTQIQGIFEGQFNSWSEVGGGSRTIRVINRPAGSGTRQAFQELVLKGANFGEGSNVITMPRDATTPLLQALKADGIGYATYAQVASQRTIRTVAVNGLTPEASNYPYQRTLYYVYKNPPSPSVQAFLGYATSPQEKQSLVAK